MEIAYKFGCKNHLESLRNGTLYCNPLKFFHNIENDEQRQDTNEGNWRIFNPITSPEDISIKFSSSITGEIIIPSNEVINISMEDKTKNQPSHLFCFSLLDVADFGEYNIPKLFTGNAVIVFDESFLNSIRQSLTSQGVRHSRTRIIYKDFNNVVVVEKKWNEKSLQYQYQKEFRIAIWGQPEGVPFIHKFTPNETVQVTDGLQNINTLKLSFPNPHTSA